MHHPIPFMFDSNMGFSGTAVGRIEHFHFRLDQIQYGGRQPFWKTSSGHNSATCHPIDFMFGSRLGFLASTDYIALFNLTAHELHEL